MCLKTKKYGIYHAENPISASAQDDPKKIHSCLTETSMFRLVSLWALPENHIFLCNALSFVYKNVYYGVHGSNQRFGSVPNYFSA